MLTNDNSMWKSLVQLFQQLTQSLPLFRHPGVRSLPSSVQSALVADADAFFVISVDSMRDIKLPIFFTHDFRANAEASRLLIGRLGRLGQFVGRKLSKHEKLDPTIQPFISWRWHHLYDAMVNLSLIDPKTTQTALAEFMAQLLPGRKPATYCAPCIATTK